jgi:hypothetical protein
LTCAITEFIRSRERGGKDTGVIFVVKPVFFAEVVFDSIRESDAILQSFYLLTSELSVRESRGRRFSDNVGGVILSRRQRDVNPNHARQVTNLEQS